MDSKKLNLKKDEVLKRKKVTLEEKKRIVCELIEIYVQLGWEIKDLLFHPLSWYDYEKVSTLVELLKKDYKLDVEGQEDEY
nr:MAG: hypothetical protein [Microvirus sp.]